MELMFVVAAISTVLTEVKCALPNKPNIVLVLLDDLGYSDIGYNNDQVLTPNMDGLARNGRILDYNYVQAVCTPSRTALMSGLYPFKTRTQHMLIANSNPHCLPTNLKILPEYLGDMGYTSHLIGKWHLGFCDEKCTPLERGFNSFYGALGGETDYFNHTFGPGYDLRDGKKVDLSGHGDFSTWLYRDRAIDIINSQSVNSINPMFLYMSFHAPHEPLKAPTYYLDMFPDVTAPRKTVLALLKAVDDAIGAVVDAMKEKGLWENTLFVLSSDNGGDFGGGWDSSPLRGGKASLWEGGNRVPGFVSGPLIQTPGGRHTGLLHVTDWLPTLVRVAGGDPSALAIDGLDQSDMIFRSLPSKRHEVVYNIDLQPLTIFGQAAIRQKEYKLIWGFEGYLDGYGPTVRKPWHMESYLALLGKEEDAIPFKPFFFGCKQCEEDKYLEYQKELINLKNFDPNDINSGSVHLFNLADDPYEQKDLAAVPDYAAMVTRLKMRILQLIDEEYVPPGNLTWAFWVPQANPMKYPNQAWSSGWCPGVDLEVKPLPRRGSGPTFPISTTAASSTTAATTTKRTSSGKTESANKIMTMWVFVLTVICLLQLY